MKVGTLAWMEATGGRLRVRDRARLFADGAMARAAARLGRRGPRPTLDPLAIAPPDSEIVRAARALCERASEPYLVQHCLRAYVWARLLDPGHAKFDDEAVFVALLLHDLGLTESHRLAAPPERCFTQVGADAVERLGEQHGWDGRRRRLAAEAITLHLNVVVDDRDGVEARMVRAGSGADVAGLGLERVPRETIDAVVARHPRLELKRRIVAPLEEDAARHPSCRTAFLVRTLGFGRLIGEARAFRE